jgi:hypothetical protein
MFIPLMERIKPASKSILVESHNTGDGKHLRIAGAQAIQKARKALQFNL